jgi:nucleoside diphosphate kinase
MPSLVLIKPDAIEQEMLGVLLQRIERYEIRDLSMRWMDYELCDMHYSAHANKEFYPGLQKFMCSAPLVAVALSGDAARVRETAVMIRRNWKHLCHGPRNLIHASDSEIAAYEELSLWFPRCLQTCTKSSTGSGNKLSPTSS